LRRTKINASDRHRCANLACSRTQTRNVWRS
jgi:hypothetical protein